MPEKRAETVIVGGGIAGVTLAYFMAKAGSSDTLLLEARQLGSGCTAGSMGGVRQQFSTPEQVELAVRGRRYWKAFESVHGVPLEFQQDGYLLVTGDDRTYEQLVLAAQVQRRLNAGDVHVLESKGLRDIAPWLNSTDLLGGTWTPLDGRMNPTDALYALATASRRLGVRYREHTPVRQVTRAASNRWQVHTLTGMVEAVRVVVACGLGTPDLVRPFGLELPITPMSIAYAVTGPALPRQQVPLTIDLDTGFCVDRHGVGLTVTVFDPAVSSGPDEMLLRFADLAEHRAPVLYDVGVRGTAVAMADATGGDGQPYIGEVEDGLWVMSGFDAHGTMQAPAVAELTAGLLAGRLDPVLDPATFDPWRQPSDRPEWLRAEKQ